jgi:hypothetical protein
MRSRSIEASFARHSRERGLRFTSAEPNIQRLQTFSHERHWIPAFAGMTSKRSLKQEQEQEQHSQKL